MKPSFTRRLTASYLFVVAVTLIFTGFYLTRRLKADFLHQLEQSLAAQASVLAHTFNLGVGKPSADLSLQARVVSLAKSLGYRMTVIAVDGVVVADSERTAEQVRSMDNHLRRPEVQSALKIGTGESTRYSATLKTPMLYVAVPIRESDTGEGRPVGVLRLALPTTEVQRRLESFRRDFFAAGVAALIVALVVALVSVRRISQPLRELVQHAKAIGAGQFQTPPPVRTSDEFGRLAAAFSDMAARVDDKVRELSQERTQLAAILSSLVESVIALDQSGAIVLLNPAAERLFRVTSADAKGRPFLEVLRHSPLNDVLTEALSKRDHLTREITLHGASEKTLSVHALPVDYGGARVGVLAALHDITELRRLERIRQEFVANASHELKTPLTSIKGFAETLLDGAIEDPAHNREFVQTIHEQANRLMRLIEDLLDLSAIEAKRVKYRLEPLSILEVTERLVKSLTPMAKEKGVALVNELEVYTPKVKADREKLTQILLNLIDNAIKFNKPGGRVTISARALDLMLEVSVADTGRGIAEEDQARVFERFFRGDRSHSQEITGTGLGLAIVKHLVEAHQGAVRLDSRAGGGATFRFTLPLA